MQSATKRAVKKKDVVSYFLHFTETLYYAYYTYYFHNSHLY